MKNSLINSAFRLALDGKKHELHELNSRFRMTYTQAEETVQFMTELGIFKRNDTMFEIVDSLGKSQIRELFYILKNRKLELEEDILQVYEAYSIGVNSLYVPNLERIDPKLKC